MSALKYQPGRTVHVIVDPKKNNGSDVATGVITREWGANAAGGWTVNVRTLVDGRASGDEYLTSIQLFDDEQAARARVAEAEALEQPYTPRVAWLPARDAS